MTDEQIKEAALNQWPFFGVSSHGDVFARYVPFGPVFRWNRNQMIPMPVQGGDLVWLLHAQEEDQPAVAEPAAKGRRRAGGAAK